MLLEELEMAVAAIAAWTEAGKSAESIDDLDQYAYCHTRAYLAQEKPQATSIARAEIANQAHKLIVAIYVGAKQQKGLQQAYEKARSYAEEHKLEYYHVRTCQAIADCLPATGGHKNLAAATEASICSIVMSINDEPRAIYAMQMHARWLYTLNLSRNKLTQLRVVASTWLRKHLGSAISDKNLKVLLSGFDAILQGNRANSDGVCH